METLNSAICILDPALPPPNQPPAPFNTFIGFGTGRFNGNVGYTIRFIFTDVGEPGSSDIAVYRIFDPNGNLIVQSGGNNDDRIQLTFGNHQAHEENSQILTTVWQIYSDTRNYPGYWPPTGLNTNTSLKSTFNRVGTNPYKSLGNVTLLDALSLADGTDLEGAANQLLRVATAALLDASHPLVGFGKTAADIKALVNDALESQDRGKILQLANDLRNLDALKHFQIPTTQGGKK